MRLSPVVQSLTEPLLSPLVSAITGVFGGGYSPTSLFADGSKGVVYDNNDLSSFYLDSFGKTPATVNGLVGLQLDKSSGLALGSEKASIASTSSGWTPYGTNTVADEDGAVKITYVTGADGAFCNITGLVSGLFYKVAVTAKVNTGSVLFAVNGSGVPFATVNETSYTDYSFYVQATATSHVIYMAGSMGAGEIIWVKNISIKELPGNHRYQTTTGSKPVLRGTPTGANLVTNGDFASDTVWTKGSGWTIGSGVATATAASAPLTSDTMTPVAGKVYRITYTITASAGSIGISLGGVFGATRTASGTYVEWLTPSGTSPNLRFTTTGFSGTLDNVEIVDVSAGQVTAPYGLQYDGVDDFMQTAAVDFTATDKMFVCAGVRKLSDAATGVVSELSVNSNANAGAFAMTAPAGAASYSYQQGGTTLQSAGNTGYPAPETAVVTGIGDIVGDIVRLRRNGNQISQSILDQGTGNFGNYALYFGRRAGTSLPFNGLDFGFVIVGKTLTSTQIANTERWMSYRTGVAL